MLPSKHLFFGVLFALILFVIFPQIGLIGFLLIVSSTVLIDVDHYLYYVYKKKDWSLKNAYKWHIDCGKLYLNLPKKKQQDICLGISFLHGIEMMVILFIIFLYFKSPFFLFILTGFVFHQSLDLIEIVYEDTNPCKVLSIIYSLSHRKNKIFLGDYK